MNPAIQVQLWSKAENYNQLMEMILAEKNVKNKAFDLDTVKKVNKFMVFFFKQSDIQVFQHSLEHVVKIRNLIYSLSTSAINEDSFSECKQEADTLINLKQRFKFNAILTRLERTVERTVGKLYKPSTKQEFENRNKLYGTNVPENFMVGYFPKLYYPAVPAIYSPLNYWITALLRTPDNENIGKALCRSIEHATVDEIAGLVERLHEEYKLATPAFNELIKVFFTFSPLQKHPNFFENALLINSMYSSNNLNKFFAAIVDALPKNLKTLSFNDTCLDDFQLQLILDSKIRLKILNLKGCHHLTDKGIKQIGKSKLYLDTLYIDDISSLKPETVEFVMSCMINNRLEPNLFSFDPDIEHLLKE